MNPDLNAPVQAAQAQKGQLDTLFAGQRNEQGGFLNDYKSLLGSQPTMAQSAQRIGDSLGLPQLQGNATMLRNTLSNLPSTYSAATRGTDVNNNQLQRIVGQKSSELAPAVETAERSLSGAQDNLSRMLGYETADKDRALLPIQARQQLMSEQQARETSGYSQQMQREFDGIIAKMQSGVQLSMQEKDLASRYALSEKQFEQQKQLNQQQHDLSPAAKQDRYVTLGDGATLYDTQTGKVVSENTKNFAGTAGGGSDWY